MINKYIFLDEKAGCLGYGMKYGIVYVAHPYGGKEENKAHSCQMCKKIKTYMREAENEGVLINPITCLGYMEYGMQAVEEEIDECLKLLDRCDCLFLTGDWRHSQGCLAEYAYALAKQKPIYEVFEEGENE